MGNRLNIVVKTLVTVMAKKKLACKLSSYANCDKIEYRCDDYDGGSIFPGQVDNRCKVPQLSCDNG